MKHRKITACGTATLLSLMLALPALAQKVSPGLWEHSMTMKSQSGEVEAGMARMQKEMASMPPEQRKMMEEMMARQGIGMGSAPGQPMSVKFCLTPEQAAREEIPQSDGNCQQTVLGRQGNTVRFKFVCSAPNAASGEGEYTLVDAKNHTGRSTVTTTRNGKPERMDMQSTGRWLAADCGAIKPRK